MTESSLAQLTEAERMLTQASTLEDLQHIHGVAEMAGAYARAAKLGLDNMNKAAEIRLKAERKAGGLLKQLERTKPEDARITSTRGNDSEYKETLDDNDISMQKANRWQQVAAIPQDDFDEYIESTKDADKELSQAGVLRVAKIGTKKKKLENRKTVPAPIGKYSIIYADPPWKYTSGDQHARETQDTVLGSHYNSMSIKELCELPIVDLADDNAVLFMWVTSPLLEEGFDVINSWGFNYKASIIWNKLKHNVGHYVSVRHELLLICTRGSFLPDSGKLLPSVVDIDRTEHSTKPEYFREMIDSMYLHGSRIELFARRKVDGWASWGNEC